MVLCSFYKYPGFPDAVAHCVDYRAGDAGEFDVDEVVGNVQY